MRLTVKRAPMIAVALAAVLLALPSYLTRPAAAVTASESAHDVPVACLPGAGAESCCGDSGCCAPKAPLPQEGECDGPCVQRGGPAPVSDLVVPSSARPTFGSVAVLSEAPSPGLAAAWEAPAPRPTESPPDVLRVSSRLRL